MSFLDIDCMVKWIHLVCKRKKKVIVSNYKTKTVKFNTKCSMPQLLEKKTFHFIHLTINVLSIFTWKMFPWEKTDLIIASNLRDSFVYRHSDFFAFNFNWNFNLFKKNSQGFPIIVFTYSHQGVCLSSLGTTC